MALNIDNVKKPPLFYGLPKIHKVGFPLRPIVAFVNSPTYQLSKHLVFILSPLTGNLLKIQVSFPILVKQHVDSDEILVSYDVVSLFTSIPVNRAVELQETI